MNADARRRLEAILENEMDVARELTESLDAERAALTGVSPEAVIAQSALKVSLLGRLEQLESSRRDLCREHDVELPPQAASAAAADGVTARWRSLMELMVRCRAANEVNGYIINVRRNQVRELIDVVRGTKTFTYGPAGKTCPKALRALATA
jgi:flagellar biosynthesis/type III secretory pathway chaperone